MSEGETDDRRYRVARTGISAVEGIEIDITVRDDGAGERDADKVLLDLVQRVGKLAAAFDDETAPDELEKIPGDYVPMMVPDWEARFSEEDGSGGDEA